MKTTIAKLKDFEGKEVVLSGWVYNLRSIGKIWFLILRDGTGLVQCVVVKADIEESIFSLGNKLTQESSVTITGVVRSEPRSVGGYELGVTNIEVHQVAEEYPISHKEHGTDFLMSNRHLWLRSKNQNAILKIRHQVIKATRDFYDNNGFTLMDSPILTANAVEGTSTLFELDYFDRSAYLTQSGQLYGESSAMAFGKIYVFGPTFRAEKSKTRRHLTEFWMVEPEMAFHDLEMNIDLAEDFLKHTLSYVLEHCRADLEFLDARFEDEQKGKPTIERAEQGLIEKLESVVNNNFIRLSYTEAIEILRNSKPNKKKKFKYPITDWGIDLQSEHERFLVEKHFKAPVVIYDYPANIKAFYMRLNDDGKTVRAMDVLFPGIGEIAGGSQREERYDVLKEKVAAVGIPEEELWWYLETRKFGTCIHSGFGLGFERLVLFATGMGNIRDVIPFPRTPGSANF